MMFFAAFLVKEMGLTQQWAGGLWALVGGLSIFCGVIWAGSGRISGRHDDVIYRAVSGGRRNIICRNGLIILLEKA